MRIFLAVLALIVLSLSFAEAQPQPSPNLMPWPAKLQMGSGQLAVDPSFSVR